MNKLFLIGFMGAGKTTVAQLLAQRLSVPYIDVDREIERVTHKTISEIFALGGERYFRALETEALSKLQTHCAVVISTGGGIVGSEQNWRLMHAMGSVIYLNASWETLLERLVDTSNRPLANSIVDIELKKLWHGRLPLYNKADLIIDTDGVSAEKVVKEILNHYTVD